MTDRAPQIERREIRLPDGRRLVYYPFPGGGALQGERPAPAEPAPPPTPAPQPVKEGR